MSWSHQNATTCMLAKIMEHLGSHLNDLIYLFSFILSYSQWRMGEFSTIWRWMHTNFNHKILLMTHYTQAEVLRISTEIGMWLLVMWWMAPKWLLKLQSTYWPQSLL